MDGAGLTRDDEVFVGWRIATIAVARIITSPVAADGLFQAGRTVRFAGRDITLTAVYADPSPSFAVTFRENGGADGTVTWEGPPEASITYPGAFDLLFRGPGTTFLGWSTSADATVADPAFDRLSISALTGDLVLYAVWEDAPAPPAPTPPPNGSGTEPGGGHLPRTGGDPWGTLLLGALLFATGIVAMTARRRRHRG